MWPIGHDEFIIDASRAQIRNPLGVYASPFSNFMPFSELQKLFVHFRMAPARKTD